ncbi:MAG: glutamate--tRNA ligase [Thermoplasmata archaeon]
MTDEGKKSKKPNKADEVPVVSGESHDDPDLETLKESARVFALENAVFFKGKAQIGPVMSRIMIDYPGARKKAKEVKAMVENILSSVNQLSLDEQKKELEELAPERLKKEKKGKDWGLPPLPNAETGKVVMRFPPEPNGYLHIGHAKAACISHEYSLMYEGTLHLRYDDSNPEKESAEFYKAQKEDLEWLGIKWSECYSVSEELPKIYEFARQLIRQGDAYTCSCDSATVKKLRAAGEPCVHREQPPEVHLANFENMATMPPKSMVLRLKADLKSPNTAFRDPTLMRIIDHPHPVQGTKYKLWPNYDFYAPIMDSTHGITHPFRSKEYEIRDQSYFYIIEKLGIRRPNLSEFARLSIEGMPVSKRLIKPLIDEGKVEGYDDIRLPTLRGLRRRGIQAEAIRAFVLSQGISRKESTVTFDQVEAFNRKLLDPKVKRLHFVYDPVKVEIEAVPQTPIRIKYHPSAEIGEREIVLKQNTDGKTSVYIAGDDASNLKQGSIFRLKDAFNVEVVSIKKDKNALVIYGKYKGTEIELSSEKIQWVPADNAVEVIVKKPDFLFIKKGIARESGSKEDGLLQKKQETYDKGEDSEELDEGEETEELVFNPDSLKVIKGLAEPAVKDLKVDEVVQFVRFGFCRLDAITPQIVFCFTHK